MIHTLPNHNQRFGFCKKTFWLIFLLPWVATAQPRTINGSGAPLLDSFAPSNATTHATRNIPCIWKNGYHYNQDIYVDISPSMPDGTLLKTVEKYIYVNPATYCTAWAATDSYVGIKGNIGSVPGLTRAYYTNNKSIAYNVTYARDDGVTLYPNPEILNMRMRGEALGKTYSIASNITLNFFKYGIPPSSIVDRACFNHWYSTNTHTEEFCVNIHITVKNPTCSAESSSLALDLGRKPADAMPYVGSVTDPTYPQNIHLRCGPQTRISASFEGTAVAERSDTFALNKTGQYATGVGVQLLWLEELIKPNQKILIHSSSPVDWYIPMRARYIRTSQSVTPGTANATIRAVFTYD